MTNKDRINAIKNEADHEAVERAIYELENLRDKAENDKEIYISMWGHYYTKYLCEIYDTLLALVNEYEKAMCKHRD